MVVRKRKPKTESEAAEVAPVMIAEAAATAKIPACAALEVMPAGTAAAAGRGLSGNCEGDGAKHRRQPSTSPGSSPSAPGVAWRSSGLAHLATRQRRS